MPKSFTLIELLFSFGIIALFLLQT
ncbi:prepilin-type N-terminal cleavage/methylation domain-containing protein [Flectobacillus longus]